MYYVSIGFKQQNRDNELFDENRPMCGSDPLTISEQNLKKNRLCGYLYLYFSLCVGCDVFLVDWDITRISQV